MNKKTLIIIGILALAVVVGTNIPRASANPSLFVRGGITVATTTTAIYTPLSGASPWFPMTAGNSTTTIQIDSNATIQQGIDSGTLMVGWAGSSTDATLQIDAEYSQDGSTWYSNVLTPGATTTQKIDLTSLQRWTLSFASTTDKTFYARTSQVGGIAGTSATNTRAILVNFPTRFVRYVFTLPTNGNDADQESKNGSLQVDFIGKRQTN